MWGRTKASQDEEGREPELPPVTVRAANAPVSSSTLTPRWEMKPSSHPPPQTHKVTVLGRAGGFTLVRMVIASRTVLNIPDDILITQTQKLKNMLLIPSETEKTQKVNCP